MNFGKKKDETPTKSGMSVIESGIEVIGEKIIGSTDIVIRGLVSSRFEVEADVTIDHEGSIEGDISCINCTVKGKVVGNISATGNLIITDEGSIVGDISCSTLEVRAGANFTGSCNKVHEPLVIRREAIPMGDYNYDNSESSIKLVNDTATS